MRSIVICEKCEFFRALVSTPPSSTEKHPKLTMYVGCLKDKHKDLHRATGKSGNYLEYLSRDMPGDCHAKHQAAAKTADELKLEAERLLLDTLRRKIDVFIGEAPAPEVKAAFDNVSLTLNS